MTRARAAVPVAAYAGTALGVCGWAFGLIVACLATGEVELLLRFARPSLVLALLLAAVVIAACEHCRRRELPPRQTRLTIVGTLLVVLAGVAALLRTCIMLVLLQNARLRGLLHATASVTSIPWLALAAVAGAGCVLLLLARRV